MGHAYAALRLLLRFLIFIFFKNVEVFGAESIPEKDAIIYAGNHPNAMVDPCIIIATTNRPVRSMAKASIFKWPIAWLWRSFGAIPVYRARERANMPDASNASNDEAFREVDKTLREGGAFAIFPEGESHTESSLKELKVGLARIALNFLAGELKRTGELHPLTIIPLAMTYKNRAKFRSSVWIKYGQGISVPPELVEMYATQDKEQERIAVRHLTAIVASAIRRYTITAPDWETVEIIMESAAVFRPSPPEPHEAPVDNFLHVASLFRQASIIWRDDPLIKQIRNLLVEYIKMLTAFGIKDADIRIHRELSHVEVVCASLFYGLAILIGLPLTFPILLLNLPIIISAMIIASYIAGKSADVIATFKVVIAFFITPFVYGVYIGVLSWACAYKIEPLMEATNHLHVAVYVIVFAIQFPLVGIAAIFLWDEVMFARKHCFRLFSLINYKKSMIRTVALRKEIHQILQAVFALAANEEARQAVNFTYPGEVKYLSKDDARKQLIEFAERHNITEPTVFVQQENDIKGKLMDNSIKDIMRSFALERQQFKESLSISLKQADDAVSRTHSFGNFNEPVPPQSRPNSVADDANLSDTEIQDFLAEQYSVFNAEKRSSYGTSPIQIITGDKESSQKVSPIPIADNNRCSRISPIRIVSDNQSSCGATQIIASHVESPIQNVVVKSII